ncbi:MAG TPA: glycoside hydrolase domain-containing protein [Chthonomonadaceae bacterium]|nr:glycoside hydrolase domain-containing protein [Chthonomonadaceae bacterium]
MFGNARLLGWALALCVGKEALFTMAAEAAKSEPIVWTVSGMERVGRRDAPDHSRRIELFAARGEYEPFQIVVRAPEGGLTDVRCAVSDLRGPGGSVLPKENLTLYREHYIEVKQSSPTWKGGAARPLPPGWYPDALIPFVDPATGKPPQAARFQAVPFTLDAGTNQPLWVDVFVPRDARPGAYHGTFTVTSGQGQATGDIVLNVWNFELPLKPSLDSSFGMGRDKSLAAIELLLRHKIMPTQVPPSAARRLIDTLGLTSVNTGFWSGAYYGHGTMKPAPSVQELKEAAARYPADLLIYNYTADEIVEFPQLYPQVKQWARALHQAGIKNLIPMAPVPELFDDGTGTGRSAVDIWVLQPNYYKASPENVAAAMKKGDQVWTYTALVQDADSPKWEIDFAPIHYRIMQGFINQSMGFTGLLYWTVDHWNRDPWTDPDYHESGASHFPGEGQLVYPGADAGVQGTVPSLRLKWIREGVEDYEYIALLQKRGKGDWALEVSRSVGRDFSHWTQDPQALEAARRKLGVALDQP